MVLDKLKVDLVEQFKGKPNLENLMAAFDRQLQDLFDVFLALNSKRSIEKADGIQLDGAGDIVGMTRLEAGLLTGDPIYFDVLDDETYRKFLLYKAQKNTSDCTYYDIMNMIETAWGAKGVAYKEYPSFPATIVVTMPFTNKDGTAIDLGRLPMIKPAGVGFLYEYSQRYVVTVGYIFQYWVYEYPLCNQLVCGVYPEKATLGKSEVLEMRISRSLAQWLYEYGLTGTMPEIATLGKHGTYSVDVLTLYERYLNTYKQLDDALVTGTWPENASIGSSSEQGVAVDKSEQTEYYDYDLTGIVPDAATLGSSSEHEVTVDKSEQTEYYSYDVTGAEPEKTTLGNSRSKDINISMQDSYSKNEYATGSTVLGTTNEQAGSTGVGVYAGIEYSSGKEPSNSYGDNPSKTEEIYTVDYKVSGEGRCGIKY